jgi:hypothetical protein
MSNTTDPDQGGKLKPYPGLLELKQKNLSSTACDLSSYAASEEYTGTGLVTILTETS